MMDKDLKWGANPLWLGFTQAVPGIFHAAAFAKRGVEAQLAPAFAQESKERTPDMGYPVRHSLISTTMRPIPRNYSTHLPSGGPADNITVGNPEVLSANARRNLLAGHGLRIPDRGTKRTEPLYKFIDGEPLSPRDSLELSRWLESMGLQNAELLAVMQKAEPSFVPTLNLMWNDQEDQALNLLRNAHDYGMIFGVSVTKRLPERIAHALYDVMSSPQSCVTSFHYPCAEISERGQDIFRESIASCVSLKCVYGFPSVLSLLSQAVPEIGLTVHYGSARQVKEELLPILRLGGVERLWLKSDLKDAHQWVADAVAEANAQLPPEFCVHEVELMNLTGRRFPAGEREKILAPLLSAKHLRDLTLPCTSWLLCGAWPAHLESLESLNFIAQDPDLEPQDKAVVDGMLEQLGGIFDRNKQLRLLAEKGAVGAFTSTGQG